MKGGELRAGEGGRGREDIKWVVGLTREIRGGAGGEGTNKGK